MVDTIVDVILFSIAEFEVKEQWNGVEYDQNNEYYPIAHFAPKIVCDTDCKHTYYAQNHCYNSNYLVWFHSLKPPLH